MQFIRFSQLLRSPCVCQCIILRKKTVIKMLLFRYYLLAAFTVIVFWWPLNYLISCFFYKRRVSRATKNIPTIDDYPFIGSALRFMGKTNEGFYWKKKFLFERKSYVKVFENVSKFYRNDGSIEGDYHENSSTVHFMAWTEKFSGCWSSRRYSSGDEFQRMHRKKLHLSLFQWWPWIFFSFRWI